MTLDVVSNFNEIDLSEHPEYAPRTLRGRPFDFVSQLVTLGRSVTAHMRDVQMWAVHTEPVSLETRARLSDVGWHLVEAEREAGPRFADRMNDRLTGYTAGDAPYVLLLDSDTFFTADPGLDLDSHAVSVGYAGGAVFDHPTWSRLASLAGVAPIDTQVLDVKAFQRYFSKGTVVDFPFFNNGAVLIRRSEIPTFTSTMRRIRDDLLADGMPSRDPRMGHFFDQICLSLAVPATPDRGLLPRGVNALSSRVDVRRWATRRRIKHFHYLKGVDLDLVAHYYSEYFQL